MHSNHYSSSSSPSIAIVVEESGLFDKAKIISDRLSLPIVTQMNNSVGLVLTVSHTGLSLQDLSNPKMLPITVSSLSRRKSASRRDLLAKAIGKKCNTIIDATAGFGGDTFDFVSRGKTVFAIERVRLISEMLMDAVQKIELNGKNKHPLIINGDARWKIPELEPADVIFLDPMFPNTTKNSALPKKSHQILRLIVGEDFDSKELLQVARDSALKRVVVKRPTGASSISDKVDFSYKGRSVRYDVYLTSRK